MDTGRTRKATSQQAISEWLARSQQEPTLAWREWADGGVALLPLGRVFVTPRLPAELVQTAVATSDPQEVAARLAQRLDGPVIYDGRTMGGIYYPLMRWADGTLWEHQDAPLLADGAYLGVPRIDRLAPPGTHWLVAPRHVDDLCEPAAVDALLTLACTTARGAEQ